jgi:hypothetical protein
MALGRTPRSEIAKACASSPVTSHAREGPGQEMLSMQNHNVPATPRPPRPTGAQFPSTERATDALAEWHVLDQNSARYWRLKDTCALFRPSGRLTIILNLIK